LHSRIRLRWYANEYRVRKKVLILTRSFGNGGAEGNPVTVEVKEDRSIGKYACNTIIACNETVLYLVFGSNPTKFHQENSCFY